MRLGVVSLPLAVGSLVLAGGLDAQEPGDTLRRLSAAQTGCDSSRAAPTDTVYQYDQVDQPVESRRLEIGDMPVRMREVTTGESVFRFIVEASGQVNRCSIALVEETNRDWTDTVVKQLRTAKYKAARKGGEAVRQLVHQTFTYHSDGRLERPVERPR
jgi:hypothetical protein